MAILRLNEPTYRILRAQGKNISRMDDQLILPGTDGQGNQIQLWGPRPDIIRLYDTPLRFFEDAAIQKWERIVTLMPLFDEGAARIAGRNDRNLRYQVQFLCRLTEREISRDREQIAIEGMRDDNTLAEKAHKLIYDWHHIFFDAITLPDDDCPNGLVDDASYTMSWEPGVEWPMALFTAEVFATRSAW